MLAPVGASVAWVSATRPARSWLRARLLVALLLVGLGWPLFAVPRATAQPAAAAPVVVDGPDPNIAIPTGLGMSVARDGTGGLVFLKQIAGTPHVFVSALVRGSFQPPQEVDVGLSSGSSQPVIAAGNGGLLLIGFVNAGTLYVVGRTSVLSGFAAPSALAGGASNPSIGITNLGKAYLAFAVADGAGSDVRTAYYYNGGWALEPTPLNAVAAADDAGTGAGRPQVGAAGDGVAVVVWGEEGHIYSRRVWGTAPSVVSEQADAPLPGCTESSADNPVVGVEGDSSYAQVAFDEQLSCSGQPQSRVLMDRLQGSQYDGVTQPDGLATTSSDGAQQPQIAMGEYGTGFVTSARQDSHQLFATILGESGAGEGLVQVNSLALGDAPYGTPANAGLYSDLIAWQQEPGTAGLPEIRVRYSQNGPDLGPEMVLSSPSEGSVDAAAGLAAGGDVGGDAVVAWVQTAPAGPQIVAAQLYQSPSTFYPVASFRYARSAHAVIAWTAAQERWGPLRYVVSVDGLQVAQTYGTTIAVPTPLRDGPHHWQVTAVNAAGLGVSDRQATVFVDTVPPTARFSLYGARRPGSQLHVYVTYRDPPQPPEPASDASGVAKVTIRWGDGTVSKLPLGWHRKFHTYKRPGRYRIAVIVVDRAGNARTVTSVAKVAPPPNGARKGSGATR